VLDIGVAVGQFLADALGVAVKHAGLWWLAGLDGHRPRTVLDTGGDVVGASVGVGGGEVHVEGTSRAVVGVEWVHASDFTGVGVHATSGLTGLDVTPDCRRESVMLTFNSRLSQHTHWCHVTLVVHETGIEVRCIVGRGAGDEGLATREGILEEVEHGEELARGHHHVVTEPTSNDRVVHDRLVGLVLEVGVPAGAELGAWPAVHLLELVLSRADLDTSLNAVGGERTSAVDLPLLEDLLLNLGVATDEVVKGLDVGLRAVGGEGQVVILEVETNTGKVDEGLDASLAELLGVTDTRALQDERRAQCTTRHDDLLAGLVDLRLLVGRQRLGRNDLDAGGAAVFDDDLFTLAVDNKVQVLVLRAGAVNVSVGRVGATSGVPNCMISLRPR